MLLQSQYTIRHGNQAVIAAACDGKDMTALIFFAMNMPCSPKGPDTCTLSDGAKKCSEKRAGSMQAGKSRTVLGYFNDIAGRYDVANTLLSLGLHHRWKRAAIAMADIRPGSLVLDVCGGTADLALRAAIHAGATGRVIVYDFSLAMLQRGRLKVSRSRAGAPVECICGDAEAMSLKEGRFDRVLIGFGLRNVQDIRAGLGEMYRMVKPGGRVVCLEFSRPTAAWFRGLYEAYLAHVLPRLGEAIAGSREPYRYLPESIRTFPAPDELAGMFAEEGFAMVRYTRIMNGIAVMHTAEKPQTH
jgi:demethylmenaquinone methyltransferase / 2-methoxy-6-polyprenyl-1,4-benzoquinol methylase